MKSNTSFDIHKILQHNQFIKYFITECKQRLYILIMEIAVGIKTLMFCWFFYCFIALPFIHLAEKGKKKINAHLNNIFRLNSEKSEKIIYCH